MFHSHVSVCFFLLRIRFLSIHKREQRARLGCLCWCYSGQNCYLRMHVRFFCVLSRLLRWNTLLSPHLAFTFHSPPSSLLFILSSPCLQLPTHVPWHAHGRLSPLVSLLSPYYLRAHHDLFDTRPSATILSTWHPERLRKLCQPKVYKFRSVTGSPGTSPATN